MSKQWEKWLVIREANEVQNEIDKILNKTFEDIDTVFKFLHNSIKKSFGKGTLPFPEKFRQSITADLTKIIEKLGQLRPANEQFIYEIDSLFDKAINEVETLDDIRFANKNYKPPLMPPGTPQRTQHGIQPNANGSYDIETVLNAIKSKMKTLISNMATQVSDIKNRELAAKVGELGSNVNQIGGDIKGHINTKFSDMEAKFASDKYGIKAGEETSIARHNLTELQRAARISMGKFGIYPAKSGSQALKIDFNNPESLEVALNKISGNRFIRVKYGNKERALDITSVQDVADFLDSVKENPEYSIPPVQKSKSIGLSTRKPPEIKSAPTPLMPPSARDKFFK